MKFIIAISLLSLLRLTSSSSGQDQGNKTCLSSEERKLYDLVMNYRKSKKLKVIPLSSKLTMVAQAHARDLADHYTVDPDNKCNPHSWSSNGKWSSCCYTSDHKQAKCMWDKPMEIASYNSPGYEIAYYSSIGASAEEGLEGWKHSPSHNPLIVNDGLWKKIDWNAVGVGIYKEFAVVWFGQLKDNSIIPAECGTENLK
jgi:uncharacterized protein YkwD